MKMKRKLALLTSAVMLLGSLNVTTAFAEASGDVNGDTHITSEDKDLVMQYVLNPGSLTEEERTLIAAEGDTSTDCIEYTASDGTVISPHAITAKDAAYILQQSMLVVIAYAKTGTVKNGVDVSSYKIISYDGNTLAEAAAAAQEEFSTMTVSEFFNYQAEQAGNVADSALDRINTFLNKVYINDDHLASRECKEWLETYLNVNSDTQAFFDEFYSLADLDNETFNVSSIDDLKKMYAAIEKFSISESELDEIMNRIYGNVSGIDEAWLRTTVMISIYDIEDGTKTTIDDAMMKDYRGSASDYSVFDWYNKNNAKSSDKTEYQPFRDNFAYFVYNYLYPVSVAMNKGEGTVEDLIKAFNGDRIEVTINEGTLPDDKYIDLYNLDSSTLDIDSYLSSQGITRNDVDRDNVEGILDAYCAFVISQFQGFDVEIQDFTTYLAENYGKTVDELTVEDDVDGIITSYGDYMKKALEDFQDSIPEMFMSDFDDPVATRYIDFSDFGYTFEVDNTLVDPSTKY